MAMTTAGSWIPTCLAINFHHFHEGKLEESTEEFLQSLVFFGLQWDPWKIDKNWDTSKIGEMGTKAESTNAPSRFCGFFPASGAM